MNSSATEDGAVAMAHPSTTVITRMNFAAPRARVWDGLMFYEQIDQPPPLHLRLLLPVPIGTETSKSTVGAEVKCAYVGGHLMKRVTRIDAGHYYGFEVAEQNLAIGGGLTLQGGSYALRETDGGSTEVAVTTNYVSHRRPAWLWKPVEAAVCHMFHRHLLSAIRRKIERRQA